MKRAWGIASFHQSFQGGVELKSNIEGLIPVDYTSDRVVLIRPVFRPLSVELEMGSIRAGEEDCERRRKELELERGARRRKREAILEPIERHYINWVLVDLCRYVGFFEKEESLSMEYIDDVAFSDENIGKWVLEHGMPSWQATYNIELFKGKAHVLLATMAAWQALKEGSWERLICAYKGLNAAAERWLILDEDAQWIVSDLSDMITKVTMAAHTGRYMDFEAFHETINVALYLHGRLLRGIYINLYCRDYRKNRYELQFVADDIFSRAAYELASIMINDRTILTPCARDGCKEMFIKRSGKQVFCSSYCRLKAHRERKGEEKRAKKA